MIEACFISISQCHWHRSVHFTPKPRRCNYHVALIVALTRSRNCAVLATNPHVVVFAVDFSKSFDTVRHTNPHVVVFAVDLNLTLNTGKSLEIVFTGRRRNARDCNPPVLPGISQVTTITMLAASPFPTVGLSLSKCAQSLYAMKVLRCHVWRRVEDHLQVCDSRKDTVYASPAWWGFSTVSDKHRLESFIRRAVWLGFYACGGPAVADLVANLDDTLFASVLANDSHVLYNLLPDCNDCSYTSLGLDVVIVCSPLGVTTETFLIDICLKTCINF